MNQAEAGRIEGKEDIRQDHTKAQCKEVVAEPEV
jgi:hypothetical protein